MYNEVNELKNGLDKFKMQINNSNEVLELLREMPEQNQAFSKRITDALNEQNKKIDDTKLELSEEINKINNEVAVQTEKTYTTIKNLQNELSEGQEELDKTIKNELNELNKDILTGLNLFKESVDKRFKHLYIINGGLVILLIVSFLIK